MSRNLCCSKGFIYPFLLALLLPFISPTFTLKAAQILVPTNFASIQLAVNNASPGDTIVVANGVYVENVNLNLMGSAVAGPTGDLVLMAANATMATVSSGAGSAFSATNLYSGDLQILNFSLTKASGTTTPVINIDNVTGTVTIAGNLFVSGFVGDGIDVGGSTNDYNIRILNNVASNLGNNDFIHWIADGNNVVDFVVDGNSVNGGQDDFLQCELDVGTYTLRASDNTYVGTLGSATARGIDLQLGQSTGAGPHFNGSLTFNNISANNLEAILVEIGEDNTVANLVIANNTLNVTTPTSTDDVIEIAAESSQNGSRFNLVIKDNILSSVSGGNNGILIEPEDDASGVPAIWNVLVEGNSISGTVSGVAGMLFDLSDINDNYSINLDVKGNTSVSGSSDAYRVICGTASPTINFEGTQPTCQAQIASANTGSTVTCTCGSVAANAVVDNNIPADVGDFAWLDVNINGLQDAEPGAPGIMVSLAGTQNIGGVVARSTFTDVDGKYLFGAVLPGSYVLSFSTNAIYQSFTLPNQGGNDAIDSDVNSSGMVSFSLLPGAGDSLTLDAGMQLFPPPCVPGQFSMGAVNDTVCLNGAAMFWVDTVGQVDSMRWQLSTDNGVTWNFLVDIPPFSGATNDTLIMSPATLLTSGYQFRAIAAACGGLPVDTSAVGTFIPNVFIVWKDLVGTAQSADTLYKISGSNGWFNGGAASTKVLPASTDGTLGHIVHGEKFIYYLGLSKINLDAGPKSIDYAFFKNKGSLYAWQKGVGSTYLGPVTVGDTLILQRSGNFMAWVKNGTPLHLVAVNGAEDLLVDASIFKKNTYLTNIFVDFCNEGFLTLPLVVESSVIQNYCPTDPSGMITVTPSGGQMPYTYLWSNAATTASVSGLSNGSYWVEVTDFIGNKDTSYFDIYTRVSWTDVAGASTSFDTLTKTVPGANWFTSGARSVQVLQANTDGEFFHVVGSVTNHYYVGLAHLNPGISQLYMDYAFYNSFGTLKIREDSTSLLSMGTVSVGDTLRIQRVGSSINYYRNSTLLRTVATNAGWSLFVDATLFNQNFALTQVYSDFCTDSLPPFPISLTMSNVVHEDCGMNNGSATVMVSGGNGPYTYDWSSGATTATATGLSSGTYQVVVTEQGGGKDSVMVTIQNKVVWENNVGTTINGDVLSKGPGNGPWGCCGARSDNKLLNGVSGQVMHIVGSVSWSYYFGLSNGDTDQSPVSIDYAFYNNNGALKIREQQTGYNQFLGISVKVGDTLTIRRQVSSMYYYKNDSLIRSIGVSPTETLMVDVALYSNNMSLSQVYVDFCDTIPGMKRNEDMASGNEALSALTEPGIELYPNPNNGQFTLELNGISDPEIRLTLVDMQGKLVLDQSIVLNGGGLRKEIRLDNVSDGFYYLKASSEHVNLGRKVVIRK
ncbi:MAG: T9SS type A sorting domain-containing protein [Bacteroidia bacterium]|nr:T9SS type A sorting domain-containing protein [Bacteroidia bacterium]